MPEHAKPSARTDSCSRYVCCIPAIQSSREGLDGSYSFENYQSDVTEAQHRNSSLSGSLRLRPPMPGYVMLRTPILMPPFGSLSFKFAFWYKSTNTVLEKTPLKVVHRDCGGFLEGPRPVPRLAGGRGWAALPRVIYTQRQASVVPMGT